VIPDMRGDAPMTPGLGFRENSNGAKVIFKRCSTADRPGVAMEKKSCFTIAANNQMGL
jgi:hypothetical protein